MLAFLLLTMLSSCRRSQADRYQRYLEDRNDSTFEYVEEPVDSLVQEEAGTEEASEADDEGLISVPDIPEERAINMSADDYEVKKAMSGR